MPNVNEKFSSVAQLYEAVFERPYPESGSRNIEIAKAELSRYLTYARAVDIDPSERRRRAVIVTEVFDEP